MVWFNSIHLGDSIYEQYHRATKIARLGGKLMWELDSEWSFETCQFAFQDMSQRELIAKTFDGREIILADGKVTVGAGRKSGLTFHNAYPVGTGHRLVLQQTPDDDGGKIRRRRYHPLNNDVLTVLGDSKPEVVGNAQNVLKQQGASAECVVQFDCTDTELLAGIVTILNMVPDSKLYMLGGVTGWLVVQFPEVVNSFHDRIPPQIVPIKQLTCSTRDFPFTSQRGICIGIEDVSRSVEDAIMELEQGVLDVGFIGTFARDDNSLWYSIGRTEIFEIGARPYQSILHMTNQLPIAVAPRLHPLPALVDGVVSRIDPNEKLFDCKLDGFESGYDVASVKRTSLDSGLQWPPTQGDLVQVFPNWHSLHYPTFGHTVSQELDQGHSYQFRVGSSDEIVSRAGNRKIVISQNGQSIE
ncbi:hypothetical protein SH501x_003196 [Pirellulaceae bacterium SH501]